MRAEYFEVEDRLVVRMMRTPEEYAAWVWTKRGWRSAPGLVGKASSDGVRLTAAEAAGRFPDAVSLVDRLAGGFSHFG